MSTFRAPWQFIVISYTVLAKLSYWHIISPNVLPIICRIGKNICSEILNRNISILYLGFWSTNGTNPFYVKM